MILLLRITNKPIYDQSLFAKMGMVVTIAQHGKEALSKILSKVFQAVIMDIQCRRWTDLSLLANKSYGDKYFKSVRSLLSASALISQRSGYHAWNEWCNQQPIVVEDYRIRSPICDDVINKRLLQKNCRIISPNMTKEKRGLHYFQPYTDGD